MIQLLADTVVLTQARLAPYPQQLVVDVYGMPARAAVLCTSAKMPLELTFLADSWIGCEVPVTVRAWLAPVDAGLPCGEQDPKPEVVLEPVAGQPLALGTAFAGARSTDCQSGTATIDLSPAFP